VICSAITHWLESRRTHNHSLLSQLGLPKPESPGPHTHVPHEQDGPAQSQSHVTTDDQSVCVCGPILLQVQVILQPSVSRPVPLGAHDQILTFFE
jgi:hypothetical protein